MSFFADYDVDLNDFEATGDFDVPDGLYDFEITNAETRVGTKKDENAVHIVIQYRLENAEGEVHSYSSWYKIPDDPAHPTQREKISMGEIKKILLASGVDESDLNTAGPDDLIGKTGTLRLTSSASKKDPSKTYQNARDWTFDGVAASTAAAPASAPTKAPARTAPAASPKKTNPFA